jgi:hypothetical protein
VIVSSMTARPADRPPRSPERRTACSPTYSRGPARRSLSRSVGLKPAVSSASLVSRADRCRGQPESGAQAGHAAGSGRGRRPPLRAAWSRAAALGDLDGPPRDTVPDLHRAAPDRDLRTVAPVVARPRHPPACYFNISRLPSRLSGRSSDASTAATALRQPLDEARAECASPPTGRLDHFDRGDGGYARRRGTGPRTCSASYTAKSSRGSPCPRTRSCSGSSRRCTRRES